MPVAMGARRMRYFGKGDYRTPNGPSLLSSWMRQSLKGPPPNADTRETGAVKG